MPSRDKSSDDEEREESPTSKAFRTVIQSVKAMPAPNIQKKLEYFFMPYNLIHTPYKHMKFDLDAPVNYDPISIDRQM